jgi:hypothetical protein
MRLWIDWGWQIYSSAGNLGEGETAEKIDHCIPEVSGEINDVDNSNQDKKGARGDYGI